MREQDQQDLQDIRDIAEIEKFQEYSRCSLDDIRLCQRYLNEITLAVLPPSLTEVLTESIGRYQRHGYLMISDALTIAECARRIRQAG